jgi:hypothetical protein
MEPGGFEPRSLGHPARADWCPPGRGMYLLRQESRQPPNHGGKPMALSLPLLLILLGIIVAIAVSWPLGVIMIVIGLVLILLPRLRGGTATSTRV